jgi:hypothetical protein
MVLHKRNRPPHALQYSLIAPNGLWTSMNVCPKVLPRGGVPVQFTVGLKLKGKTDHIAVDAEDALIAPLKVKTEHPEAVITYVRQQNRRGDARHPSHGLSEDRP